MSGDEEKDRAQILAAAPGPIDVVLDLMPPAATAVQVTAALMTVRPQGRVVLMGGVQEKLPLPYGWLMRNGITLRGQWMYTRESIGRLIALVRAGLLDLEATTITRFPLGEVNEAVAHAGTHAGAFEATVVCP